MSPESPSLPQELPSSPPIQKSFNLNNVARLSESIWNSKRERKGCFNNSSNGIFTKGTGEDQLSSDPITAQDIEPQNTGVKPNKMKSKKRKSPDSNPPASNSRKVIQIAEPKITRQHTFLSAIQEARNLLVKAYSLTENKEKQDAVLYLVEVFRYYVEEGRVRPIPIQKLMASPSVPLASKEVPAVLAVPNPTIPSYAQILKKNSPTTPPSSAQPPASGMKVLNKSTKQGAPTVSPIETVNKNAVPKPSPIQTTTTLSRENVVTLITKQGEILPTYDALSIRESINVTGTILCSRDHHSVFLSEDI